MIKRLFVIMISLFIGIIGVNAANGNAPEGSVNFKQFKAEYDKGIIPTTINGEGIITLYGFADCHSSGCSIIYNNQSSDYKEVLKKTVKCSGGESNINYSSNRDADLYSSTNNQGYEGIAYFAHEFTISCTSNTTSTSIPLSSDNTGGTSGGTSSGGTSSGGTSSGGTSSGGYNSSSTTNNPDQGVETYYIVLGIVGLLTYLVMFGIKKMNLFKNV